ncbi:FecR family protein [Chitinophaga sedimenti]|uniref:FecR domain-containing protein n=1 Tax=Chitinophaga sedimenti TaxID=2033606 RepID=UPI002006305C|nr:FecR family protein [Chitinophaga sedimenti]MCK7559360.1 FecR family protein [Chitinophaga sedimenti]
MKHSRLLPWGMALSTPFILLVCFNSLCMAGSNAGVGIWNIYASDAKEIDTPIRPLGGTLTVNEEMIKLYGRDFNGKVAIGEKYNCRISNDTGWFEPVDPREPIVQISTHELYVPVGRHLFLFLPDGSQIYILPQTTLSIDYWEYAKQASVTVSSGEACFYLKKSPVGTHFRVKTAHGEVRSDDGFFTVRALEGDDLADVLVSAGTVSSAGLPLSFPVLPALFHLTKGMAVETALTRRQIESRDVQVKYSMKGYFYYPDAFVAEIVLDMERWYNLTLATPAFRKERVNNYHIDILSHRTHYGQLAKSVSASRALEVSVKGNKIYVRPYPKDKKD